MGDYHSDNEDTSAMYTPTIDLLGDDNDVDGFDPSDHTLRTAPVFTGDVLSCLGTEMLPQRALYGRVVSQHSDRLPQKTATRELYINTNTPFSAVVCGVQGSGKSHSTSVLLESCLMKCKNIGTLPNPLSALVFHYDTAAGGGLVQPYEAAYLATLDATRGQGTTPPQVTVLVLPNNLNKMKKVYAGLPEVKVEPLLFSPEDISGERLLAMMKVEDGTQMPLYMESIMAILRSMEDNFSYEAFRQELKNQKFNPGQKAMLNLRLSLLDSCLKDGGGSGRVATHFQPGQLTIVDLSSPFMDGCSACGFFDIILGLFIEAEVGTGKLVVLDEAHKYLSESQSGSSSKLTDSLLSIIRQQRHLATRVVISTQEPTVIPTKFLDLCSFIIAHRFSSPKWLQVLGQHISAAQDNTILRELFSKIVTLKTGHALMFAPNGLCLSHPSGEEGSHQTPGTAVSLGEGYLLVKSRLRITRDGGHSILAVSDPEKTTRLGRVSVAPNTTSGTVPQSTSVPSVVQTPPSSQALPSGAAGPSTTMDPGKSENAPQGPSLTTAARVIVPMTKAASMALQAALSTATLSSNTAPEAVSGTSVNTSSSSNPTAQAATSSSTSKPAVVASSTPVSQSASKKPNVAVTAPVQKAKTATAASSSSKAAPAQAAPQPSTSPLASKAVPTAVGQKAKTTTAAPTLQSATVSPSKASSQTVPQPLTSLSGSTTTPNAQAQKTKPTPTVPPTTASSSQAATSSAQSIPPSEPPKPRILMTGQLFCFRPIVKYMQKHKLVEMTERKLLKRLEQRYASAYKGSAAEYVSAAVQHGVVRRKPQHEDWVELIPNATYLL